MISLDLVIVGAFVVGLGGLVKGNEIFICNLSGLFVEENRNAYQ